MIMELPKKFEIESYAKVENGILYIYRLERFEDLMYELTYACKKKKCVYCSKKLKRNHSTLDHRYPRDTGGISITNNLFPCCSNCNSKKSSLTHEEFLKIRELPKDEKKKLNKQFLKHKEKIMKKIGYKLPKKWVTSLDVSEIRYEKPNQDLRGKKYHRILAFYEKYNKLPRPVIIDANNRLLDGYNVILFANDSKIKTVPVIRLDNVELLDANMKP